MEEHAVEPVLDVMFAASDRAKLRVGVSDQVEESDEGSAELHSFRGSVRFRGFVERRPPPVPGVVGKQSWSAVTFVLDRGRPDHEFDELSD